jgi:hypothetical protein
MQDHAAASQRQGHASPQRSEIALSGFSGARVLLIRENGGQPFVRKIAATPSGNARLGLQAAKQKLTAGLLAGVATTPRILEEGEIDSCYYFDMEYVRGLDGISFLRVANFDEATALCPPSARA